MYKDKTKQKEANREAAKRYRKGMTQGMTGGQGMTQAATSEGITLPAEGITDVPDFARVLPQDRIDRIKAILRERARVGLFDDSNERWERAISYLKWEQSGKPMTLPEKLVTQRKGLEAMVEACHGRKDMLTNIRVGLDGPDLATMADLLECTA